MEIRRLPDGELEVMQALWACGAPAARKDIEEILFVSHPMAMTTLLTLLTRLEEKGFLSIRKEGRRSLYTPLITREDYQAAQSKRFVDRVCCGSMSAFANALCRSGLSQAELAELRELLERRPL